jgi:hypothetical protein
VQVLRVSVVAASLNGRSSAVSASPDDPNPRHRSLRGSSYDFAWEVLVKDHEELVKLEIAGATAVEPASPFGVIASVAADHHRQCQGYRI